MDHTPSSNNSRLQAIQESKEDYCPRAILPIYALLAINLAVTFVIGVGVLKVMSDLEVKTADVFNGQDKLKASINMLSEKVVDIENRLEDQAAQQDARLTFIEENLMFVQEKQRDSMRMIYGPATDDKPQTVYKTICGDCAGTGVDGVDVCNKCKGKGYNETNKNNN